MQHRGLVMGVALVLLGAAPALAEDEPWLKFSTSVNYSVGDYGTGKDTTIVYVPFTLGVRPLDRFWLSVTVPFIYQDTQNVVLTGGGVASRKEQKGKLAQPARRVAEGVRRRRRGTRSDPRGHALPEDQVPDGGRESWARHGRVRRDPRR